MRRPGVLLMMCLVAACGGKARSYDVLVDNETLCRAFDPTPEACAPTNGAAVRMVITIEERNNHRAIVYGRSDGTADGVYLAEVPRSGRYEITEEKVDTNGDTRCDTRSKLVLVLDVDDQGLSGGEENRIEETKQCNTFMQHRVTRRLRDWKGSRVTSEKSTSIIPSL